MTTLGDQLSTLLGQSIFAKPESLPAANDVATWLFERPVMLAIVFGLFASVCAFKAIQRATKRLWLVSILLAALAASSLVLGQLVTTDRETLRTNTHHFIQSVVDDDASSALQILSGEVSLLLGSSRVPGVGKVEIVNAIPLVQRQGVTGATVKELQAVIDGPNVGRTQMLVRVSVGGTPTLTWWHMDWRKENESQWRIFRLRCLLINGREPSAAMFSMLR